MPPNKEKEENRHCCLLNIELHTTGEEEEEDPKTEEEDRSTEGEEETIYGTTATAC